MDETNNMNMGGMPPQEKSGSAGSLIAVVVVLAVIVAAALYFWRERGAMDENMDDLYNNNAALETINAQSTSDEAASIEADLNATDVENVDYDLNEENFTAS
jgi:hypothetical protein